MSASLRKPWGLFLLVLLGQIGTLLIDRGDPTMLTLPEVSAAILLAAAIALLWDVLVQRPVRQGLSRLERRMRRRAEPDAPVRHAVHDAHTRRLDRMLVTRQRRLAAYVHRLRAETERLQAIYRHSHDAVLIFAPSSGRLVDCNPRAEQMLGVAPGGLADALLDELHDEDEAYMRALVDDVMDSEHGRSIRISYCAGDGRVIPAEVSVSRIRLDGGDLLLWIARDISEREDAAQRIQHLAYHDTLTNLPNRTLLTERVDRALVRARRTGQSGALLFVDLDKFKRINDSLGHSVGDELLKEFARRLRDTLREEDTVARLGGDEFVVLLEALDGQQDRAVQKAREIAEKLRTVFADEYRLVGHELYVTASIGLVTFPHNGDTVDTLLRHADTAMYHAKGSGRDGTRVFERGMDEAATSRLRLENELRTGLREGQFELYFQPVLGIRDGQVLGAEVLLRWRHPTDGLIAPCDFLPYIENSALMLKLDDWVLHESCRLLGRVQRDPAMHAPDCLSINVSHQQFHQPDFEDRVAQIVADTGADPQRLQFEITETILIRNTRETVDRMNALKQRGIRFAIDDFGTGYSSLADLRRLPIDTIKIDRTFIRDIDSDPNDAAIVKAVLSMARHVGLNVIAEGVETREQLVFLRNADCSYYQGYLGRPPLSSDSFRNDLRFGADLFATAKPTPAQLAEPSAGATASGA